MEADGRQPVEHAESPPRRERYILAIAWLALPLIALVWGKLMPGFYDWTGSDQSRLPGIVPRIALGIMLIDAVLWAGMIWHSWARNNPSASQIGFKVSLRYWFLATLLLAAGWLIAIQQKESLALGCWTVVLAYGIWQLRWKQTRGRLANLLACMYLPYAWLVDWRDMFARATGMFLGIPGFLPSMFFESWILRWNSQGPTASLVATALMLLLGIWLSKRSARLTYAYLLLVLTQSLFGSFILQALVRM